MRVAYLVLSVPFQALLHCLSVVPLLVILNGPDGRSKQAVGRQLQNLALSRCQILQVVRLGEVLSNPFPKAFLSFPVSQFDYKYDSSGLDSITALNGGLCSLGLGSWLEGQACLKV